MMIISQLELGATCRPKQGFLYFTHGKGLGQMFEKSWFILQFSFLLSQQTKNDFWLNHA